MQGPPVGAGGAVPGAEATGHAEAGRECRVRRSRRESRVVGATVQRGVFMPWRWEWQQRPRLRDISLGHRPNEML